MYTLAAQQGNVEAEVKPATTSTTAQAPSQTWRRASALTGTAGRRSAQAQFNLAYMRTTLTLTFTLRTLQPSGHRLACSHIVLSHSFKAPPNPHPLPDPGMPMALQGTITSPSDTTTWQSKRRATQTLTLTLTRRSAPALALALAPTLTLTLTRVARRGRLRSSRSLSFGCCRRGSDIQAEEGEGPYEYFGALLGLLTPGASGSTPKPQPNPCDLKLSTSRAPTNPNATRKPT